MDEDELIQELTKRCRAAQLSVEDVPPDEFQDEDGFIHRQRNGWFVRSAIGAFQSKAHLHDGDTVQQALRTSFERYSPIDGYEAIWSKDGTIEAELVLRDQWNEAERAFVPLLSILDPSWHKRDLRSTEITLPTGPDQPTIALRFGSPELLVWRTASPAIHLLRAGELVPALQLRIGSLADAEEATRLMLDFGNAVLLELDRSAGFAARLRTHYPWALFPTTIGERQGRRLPGPPSLVPERVLFDLYSYARIKRGDPAGSFLAFYRVLEYCFPRCSIQREVARLRDCDTHNPPALASLSDELIARVLDGTHRGRGVGGESSQLSAVVQAIVKAGELRSFIERDAVLRDFYRSASLPIASERVRIEIADRDVREDLVQRLYKIRCRIVHSKESDDGEAFVPFTPEAAELRCDTKVLRFLAQQAVCSFAQPVR